jgi:hypothetical protein
MVKAFIESIKEGGSPLISANGIFAVTRATFAVIESIKTGKAISI